MGSLTSTALVSLLTFVLCNLPANVEGYECTGLGRRYCSDKAPAHRSRSECPKPCQRRQCRGRRSSELERRGAQRDSSEGGTPTWEEIAETGLYDHVYVDGNEICLASCWYEPWNAKCYNWQTHLGARYCKGLNCKHDKGNRVNSGTRYSGCHADRESGRRKLPWHRPTCKECTRVFPEACFNELRQYYSKRASQKIRQNIRAEKQKREMQARRYCYLTYFGPVLGSELDLPTSSEAASEKNDSSDASDSSSGRRLLQRAGKPFANNLNRTSTREFKRLEERGQLTCPAPQCLTAHNELLQTLITPWYHASEATGRCSFNSCQSNQNQGPRWCQKSVQNCIGCKGTWCPPKAIPFWKPIDGSNFRPDRPFYADNKIADRFPRTACRNQPLTQISQADAQGLPWFDPAGDIFAIKPKARPQRLQDAVNTVQDTYNADLIAEHKREEKRVAKEKKQLAARLLAQSKARQALQKKQEEEAEKSRQAAAAEAARKQMQQEARLAEEQQKANARGLEAAARQFCYDKYVSEAARYSGVDGIGDGLDAVEVEEDSEGSQNFQLQEMEESGQLSCPPAECYFDEVVQEFADDARSVSDDILFDELDKSDKSLDIDRSSIDWATRSLLPWYYQTPDGFCSWTIECNPNITAAAFCSKGSAQCLSCGGAWCPPVEGQGWSPATKKNHLKLNDALDLVSLNPLVVIGNNSAADGNATTNGDSLFLTRELDLDEEQSTITMFDYRRCTNSSVTELPLAQANDLFWPGFIDFTAAIAKQRGIVTNANGRPRRAGRV